MLGGLVTPAHSSSTSLGMGLYIKLERECLAGCGVDMAQHWQLKPEALCLIEMQHN